MRRLLLGIFFAAAPVLVSTAHADPTASEIVAQVCGNLSTMSDMSATTDTVNTIDDDMNGAVLSWKRNSGNWKAKMVLGSPYSASYWTDASAGWNFINADGLWQWFPVVADGWAYLNATFGMDLFNMERILAGETWTKDPNTATINSIECYRIYCDDYEAWVDTATYTKVIRVIQYVSGELFWKADYSDYTTIDDVLLPTTMDATAYDDEEEPYMTITYTFSDISVNAGISDSIFAIEELYEEE